LGVGLGRRGRRCRGGARGPGDRWTGTGAAIAANKVAGVRAALCADAVTAAGARRWNDANVLALSLRAVGEGVLGEILDVWFATAASAKPGDRANVEHLAELDDARRPG
jgi:ribose 5-phosphate isomerase B